MEPQRVIREDGQIGTVVGSGPTLAGEPQLVVAYPDGTTVTVPTGALEAQPDGTYRVAGATVATDEEVVIPVIAEELSVTRRQVARGKVRINKRVESHIRQIDEPTIREEVIVERVPMNTLIEGDPPGPREENGVLVIPVIEEILVTEKRLVLREELRVTRRRTEVANPQEVTLRREVVEIERLPAEEEAAPGPQTTA